MLHLCQFFCRCIENRFRSSVMAFVNRVVLAFCFSLVVSVTTAAGAELMNDATKLTLGFTPSGVPAIEKAEWLATGEVIFTDAMTADSLDRWIPDKYIPASLAPTTWRLRSGSTFHRGEATLELLNGLRMTWIVELARSEATFRLRVRLRNTSDAPLGIKWFPTWNGDWQMQDGEQWVQWWRALSFGQSVKRWSGNEQVVLGSHLTSSDYLDNGENPYWVVGGNRKRTFFALEWCGGWEATIKNTDGAFQFNVRLPQAETQLTLLPDEVIDGPILWVTPTTGLDEAQSRQAWMARRRALGQIIFGGPEPSFPLTYNTWYTTYGNVNRKYLRKQIEAMEPFCFDAFIVDAGWYDNPDRWQADPAKFRANELESMLTGFKEQGVIPGLWSTPQYTSLTGSQVPAMLEQPGYFNDISGGYLIDIAGNDFRTQVKQHVAALRTQFAIDWWKYDQKFFLEESRSGLMKNVIALQRALYAVRLAHPTLTIENCLNGGRMINEFTALNSQILWLRDGQISGLEHAQQNIQTALGAADFLFPWQAYRFTQNFETMPAADDELTRLYCRSAMIGTWGISTNLPAISDRQRAVLLREIRYYKLLAPIKLNYLYELDQPAPGKAAAGVTFYGAGQQSAGVLLYRWEEKREFRHRLVMKQLDPDKLYRVRDTDRKTRVFLRGSELMTTGVEVLFPVERLSALLFVDAMEEPAPEPPVIP